MTHTGTKTLYIETKSGAAGDMLMSALYSLCPDKSSFLHTMNQLFPGTIVIKESKDTTCGIEGYHLKVEVLGQEEGTAVQNLPVPSSHHDHSHGFHYSDILSAIDTFPIPEKVKEDAKAIYRLIGEAESKVHNTPLDHVHFHEVGSLDAIADVTGCALLMHMLSPDHIYGSPIHVGNGMVHCAHGSLPVPAPATAELLKGIPYYTGEIQTELCTPTGAAILRYYVQEFKSMSPMSISAVGIGVGTKKLPSANLVRIFLGELEEDTEDVIIDISCNLDDMTGEAMGYTMELLLEEGALDVFYQPIQMKKNRPGILLHCFCPPERQDYFCNMILTHTTTRGVRFQEFHRKKMQASIRQVNTPYGPITIKDNTGYGIHKSKPEYEDIKKAAHLHHVPLQTVIDSIKDQ